MRALQGLLGESSYKGLFGEKYLVGMLGAIGNNVVDKVSRFEVRS